MIRWLSTLLIAVSWAASSSPYASIATGVEARQSSMEHARGSVEPKNDQIQQHMNCTIAVASDPQLEEANAQAGPGDVICLQPGIYHAQIRPARSGSSEDQRILYRKEGSASANVKPGFDLSGRAYVTVSGIDVDGTDRSPGYANLNDSDHVIIEEGRFTGVDTHPGFNMIRTSYAVIRANFVSGRTDGGYIDVFQLLGFAHHNLIENNTFEQLGTPDQDPHTIIYLSGDGTEKPGQDPQYNIIRNNTFYDEVHHCINVQGGSHHNLFEANYFRKCGESGETWHAWQSEAIYRFNVALRSAGEDVYANAFGGLSYWNGAEENVVQVVKNRIYHNVFYDNGGFAFRLGIYANQQDQTLFDYGDNRFINNILYHNNQYTSNTGRPRIDYDGPETLEIYYERSWDCPTGCTGSLVDIHGDEWRNNLIGDPGAIIIRYPSSAHEYTTLQEASQWLAPKVVFTDNIQGDPSFVNAAIDDFRLGTGSPAVDAGDFLTRTVSAGSGTILPVADARLFTDGFGIVEGDAVQVGSDGQDGTLRITAVDYQNNRLTLSRSIGWEANEGVSMPYQGSRPDIGAYESGEPPTRPTFADVPLDHPYHDYVEAIYQAGYTAGCSTDPLLYCPEATMNRAESAVFVERGIHSASFVPATPVSQVFADLPLDSWAAGWVDGLWDDGYTAGCGTAPLLYCPWQGHSRAEAAVFYLRMLRGADYTPAQPTSSIFADVPIESWYARWVHEAYNAGLIEPCEVSPQRRYCPDAPLTRAIAAYMMAQAKGLMPPPAADWWRPVPGLTWQWQITGKVDETVEPAQMFDIDLTDAMPSDRVVTVAGYGTATWPKGINVELTR